MKMQGICAIVTLVFGTVSGHMAARAEGDPERGKAVYAQCQACHMVGENATNRFGPILNDIFGRKAGTIPGFPYTPLNRAAGENGLVWTLENLEPYLADPTGFLKKFLIDAGKPELAQGKSSMVFKVNLTGPRKNIVAFLALFSKAK